MNGGASCSHLLLLLQCMLRVVDPSRKAQRPTPSAVVPGQVSMTLKAKADIADPVALFRGQLHLMLLRTHLLKRRACAE